MNWEFYRIRKIKYYKHFIGQSYPLKLNAAHMGYFALLTIGTGFAIGHSKRNGCHWLQHVAALEIKIHNLYIYLACSVFFSPSLPFWLTEKEHKQTPMNLATNGSSPPVLLYWMLFSSLCLQLPNSHKATLILTSYVITPHCRLIIVACTTLHVRSISDWLSY